MAEAVADRFPGGRLVLASGNRGKLAELEALLGDLGLRIEPQSAHDVPAAPEEAVTFVENALTKARHACRCTGLPALADDSGLAVAALNGAPGVVSARYAGPGASDRDNIDKLLGALDDVEPERRDAYFYCVLVLMRSPEDPVPLICEGRWQGAIAHAPRGEQGFGYDPVFYDARLAATAAELEPATKQRVSHRGQALTALRRQLTD